MKKPYALTAVYRHNDILTDVYVFADGTSYCLYHPCGDYMDMSGKTMPENKRPALAIYNNNLNLTQAIAHLILYTQYDDQESMTYYRIAIELLADPSTLKKS